MALMTILGYINIFPVGNTINLALVVMVHYTTVNRNSPTIDNMAKLEERAAM